MNHWLPLLLSATILSGCIGHTACYRVDHCGIMRDNQQARPWQLDEYCGSIVTVCEQGWRRICRNIAGAMVACP